MSAITAYGQFAVVLSGLPKLVHQARRSRGMSLRQAAQQIGIRTETVRLIEHGRADPRAKTVWLVLRWLDRINNNDPTTVVRNEPTVGQQVAMAARQERARRVRELHVQGLSQHAIAAKLAVTQPTVFSDLRSGGPA